MAIWHCLVCDEEFQHPTFVIEHIARKHEPQAPDATLEQIGKLIKIIPNLTE